VKGKMAPKIHFHRRLARAVKARANKATTKPVGNNRRARRQTAALARKGKAGVRDYAQDQRPEQLV
jgi:hypothetical protein